MLCAVTAEPLVDAAALTAALTGPERLFTAVSCLASTGSTNADLAARGRTGAPSGLVLVADHQRSGRGRLDRQWEAPPGTSLAVSMLLRPDHVEPERWSLLSLVAGLAVVDGIAEACGVQAGLKWPNDVLIGAGKVCGILSERVEDAAVVGFGINTTLTAAQLPAPTATSLALAGARPDPTRLVIAALTAFERGYRAWARGEDLRPAYRRASATIGQQVRVVGAAGTVEGMATGVDEWGRLLVDTPSGPRAFAVGDVVHLRPQ